MCLLTRAVAVPSCIVCVCMCTSDRCHACLAYTRYCCCCRSNVTAYMTTLLQPWWDHVASQVTGQHAAPSSPSTLVCDRAITATQARAQNGKTANGLAFRRRREGTAVTTWIGRGARKTGIALCPTDHYPQPRAQIHVTKPKKMTQAAHKRGSQLAPKHYCSQGLPSAALLQEHALASSLRMHPTITAQHAALLTRPASWRWRRSSWPAKVARRQGTTWHWLTAWHYKKRKLLGCRLLPHDVMDMPTANPIPPYPCAHDTLL